MMTETPAAGTPLVVRYREVKKTSLAVPWKELAIFLFGMLLGVLI